MASDRAQGAAGPSHEEIEAFAADWYRKLDEHVPAPEIMSLVLDQGLEFVVPEATLRSRDEFGTWYAGGEGHPGIINLFFDELHTLTRIVATPGRQRVEAKVIVNWQARRWRPPSPRSEWIGFDAFQTWELIRSPETGSLLIARYVVDELQPMPGSPPL